MKCPEGGSSFIVSLHFGLPSMVFIFWLISHEYAYGSKSINSRIGPGSSKLLPLSKMPELFHTSSSGLSEASLAFCWIYREGQKSHTCLSMCVCVCTCVCMHVCACMCVCACTLSCSHTLASTKFCKHARHTIPHLGTPTFISLFLEHHFLKYFLCCF